MLIYIYNMPLSSDLCHHVNMNNRQETHKLYSLMLPYSLYGNPYKQYFRKVKLKKHQNISTSLNGSDLIIISSNFNGHMLPISGDTANGTGTGSSSNSNGVKTRKKMKLTSNFTDVDTEMPKVSSSQNTGEEENTTNVIILKPVEYEKMNTNKYSLADLKVLCTHYNIKKSGTKLELTQRLHAFLKHTYFITRIQRKFKQFLSRKYSKLCGPGYLHSSNCVNDTDFYTFDKISNIKPMELFTYLDIDNKIYGFHIASIFHLIITSYPTITNPYNRNIITSSVIKNVYEKLIYGSLLGFRVSVKLDDDSNDDDMNNNNHNSDGSSAGSFINGGQMALSREKQEELYVVDLFQHINTLGNYSDSEWFITLQRDELIRFIRNIHDIWYYRANLTQEMKERISPPHGNPFVVRNAQVNLTVITILTTEEIRTICISVIERMTSRGVSREDQCLGAFYVLATLTIVNQDARNALPWLYEAVI